MLSLSSQKETCQGVTPCSEQDGVCQCGWRFGWADSSASGKYMQGHDRFTYSSSQVSTRKGCMNHILLNSLLSIKEGTVSYQFSGNCTEEPFIVAWRVNWETVCKIMYHARLLSSVKLSCMFTYWCSIYPCQLPGAKTNFPDQFFSKFTIFFFVLNILNIQSLAQSWLFLFHT